MGRTGEHEVVVFVRTGFGEGAPEQVAAEFDVWGLTGERRLAATGTDAEIETTVRRFFDAGATTVLLQSRSHEPDLHGFVDAVGRIGARLAS